MTSRALFVVLSGWFFSACTASPATVTEPVAATTPDQDTLHEFLAPVLPEDPEERAEVRQQRDTMITQLETLYDSSKSEIVRAGALYDLSRLHQERAFDLKDQAEAAHRIEADRYLIGELAVEPSLKLDAYREELLRRVNVLRDMTSNFPRDPRIAEVTWQLASTMARVGNDHCEYYFKQAALMSKTPEWANKVKLSRADYLMSKNQFDDAIKLYTEVREAVKDAADPIKAYATYRLGWGYLAKNDKKKGEAALKLAFLGLTKDEPVRFRLRQEAALKLADLWAEAGNEKEATEFAATHDLPHFMDTYQARLAEVWERQGKFDKVIAYDRDQIVKRPLDADVPNLHLQIAHAYVATGNVNGMNEEIASLNKLVSDETNPWYEEHHEDEAATARIKKMVNLLPLASGFKLFKQAQAEKDVKKQKTLMTAAVKTLQDQQKTVTDPAQSLAVRMSLVQGLIVLERFTETLDQLDALVKLGPKAEPHLTDAAFERLKIIVKLDGDQKYPPVPEPGEAKSPIPLPALKQRFAAAAEDYLKLVPEADNKVNLRFQIAQDLFSYGHYSEALPLFEQIATEFPRTDQGKAGIEIVLSMNLKKKNYEELIRLSTAFLNNRNVRGKVLREFIKQNLDWAKEQTKGTGATAH